MCARYKSLVKTLFDRYHLHQDNQLSESTAMKMAKDTARQILDHEHITPIEPKRSKSLEIG